MAREVGTKEEVLEEKKGVEKVRKNKHEFLRNIFHIVPFTKMLCKRERFCTSLQKRELVFFPNLFFLFQDVQGDLYFLYRE